MLYVYLDSPVSLLLQASRRVPETTEAKTWYLHKREMRGRFDVQKMLSETLMLHGYMKKAKDADENSEAYVT